MSTDVYAAPLRAYVCANTLLPAIKTLNIRVTAGPAPGRGLDQCLEAINASDTGPYFTIS